MLLLSFGLACFASSSSGHAGLEEREQKAPQLAALLVISILLGRSEVTDLRPPTLTHSSPNPPNQLKISSNQLIFEPI
eukprot:6469739-Amphidinium_carterae.1